MARSLLLVPLGVGWMLATAGWSREQASAAAILVGTALSRATEAVPLFGTAFISIAAQMFFASNSAGWGALGFEQVVAVLLNPQRERVVLP